MLSTIKSYAVKLVSAIWASWTSGYTCWVRYVLTLAISPIPQEEFRLVINQSVGSCRVKLIPEVWSCLSAVCYQRLSLLHNIMYVIYFMHCLLILPLTCSYMWDLTSKTHICCISSFVLKIEYYKVVSKQCWL